MDIYEKSIEAHEKYKGKVSIKSKWPTLDLKSLALAYTPGVAEPCRKIALDTSKVFNYTLKSNSVAVISDGSAVLGLGNIGADASIPVMEGKCILFKEFADIDAFPICINSNNVEEIIQTIKLISPVFGGINLEDISSPRCFEIEKRLKNELDIPVFHDDQHGTAIVVLAALINALKVVGKKPEDVKIVINGPGAAGTAILKFLLSQDYKDIIVCDRTGIISKNRLNLDENKLKIAKITNSNNFDGSLLDALNNTDVFIGVSVGNIVSKEMIKCMAEKSIIFALANPIPEIMPEDALNAGAFIVSTGRSDYPNQINNVLGFPGIFRGALDSKAKEINEEMKVAAAHALASIIPENELNQNNIIPSVFDKRVVETVSKAVSEAAIKTNCIR